MPTFWAGSPAFPSHSPRFHQAVEGILEFRIVRREPGMEPFLGVVIGIDAGIIGGEMFHLIEAMRGGIGIRYIAEMPLAREVGGVAVLLKEFGDRRRLLAEIVLVAWSDNDRERRADGDAPGDERGAARGAARLAVPIREGRALLGHAIDVRRGMAERCASAVSAEITPAGIVGHQHDDVGPLLLRLRLAGDSTSGQQRVIATPARESGDCARMTELRSARPFFRKISRPYSWAPPRLWF